MLILFWLLYHIGPLVAGGICYAASNRCRGRNARFMFRYAAAGFVLLMLRVFNWPFGWLPLLNFVIQLAPAALCFFIALHFITREARSQQRGEFTERA
ncbi:MAG: hypothetical protein KGK12_10595 [Armatimonadetes bacterium]|nr:hypothetical protein [Armatimonadota bacterium]